VFHGSIAPAQLDLHAVEHGGADAREGGTSVNGSRPAGLERDAVREPQVGGKRRRWS